MAATAHTIRLVLVTLAALVVLSAAALAQDPRALISGSSDAGAATTAVPSTAEALAALEAAGATVVIVPQETVAPAVTDAAAQPDAVGQVAQLRERLGPVLMAAPALPGGLVTAMRVAGDDSLSWLWAALALTLLGLGVGTAAYLALTHLTLKVRAALLPPEVDTRGIHIAYAFSYIVTAWLSSAGLLIAGTLAVILVEPSRVPEQVTAMMVLRAVASFMAFRGVVLAVINGTGEGRLAPFDKPLAKALQTQLLVSFFITNTAAWICFWSARFPLPEDAHKFMLLVAATASAGLFLAILLYHRRALTASFFGRGRSVGGLPPRPPGAGARLAGLLWPVAATAYFVIAWGANVRSILTFSAPLIGPVAAPILAFVAALAVTGVFLFVFDTRIRRGLTNDGWTELYEKSAYAAGGIVWFMALAGLWGLYGTQYGDDVQRGVLLLVTLLLSWAGWRAVNIAIDQRLAEEIPAVGADQAEGEGFGPGQSRIATLLPIARKVAFFFIAMVVLMSVLASLGVNVAPLFAGAGVLGLAVGFGAQALIRDVFSGAFFLLDDAFRKGEYIDVGGTAGMVEKISVRSFQLRHHEGPLHTLPFGEIKQLTNFSRDWVIMKLPIRLTYATDIEKVRKLVKKVGVAMAADPDIGHYFLEPPKSQGVVQMEDSAMIIRVKFMTKPGDQFMVRKHVFQRIRDAFVENDIHFAHREVTVRVAGTDDPDTQRAAAAGGAHAAESRPLPSAGAASELAGL